MPENELLLEEDPSGPSFEPASQPFEDVPEATDYEQPQDDQPGEQVPSPEETHYMFPRDADERTLQRLFRDIAEKDEKFNRSIRTIGGRERVQREAALQAQIEELQAREARREAEAFNRAVAQMPAEEYRQRMQNPRFVEAAQQAQRAMQVDPEDAHWRTQLAARFEMARNEGVPEERLALLWNGDPRAGIGGFSEQRMGPAVLAQSIDALNWEMQQVNNQQAPAAPQAQPQPARAPQGNPRLATASPDLSPRGGVPSSGKYTIEQFEKLAGSMSPTEFFKRFPKDLQEYINDGTVTLGKARA